MRYFIFLLFLASSIQSKAYGDTLVLQKVEFSSLNVGTAGSVFVPKNRLFFIEQSPIYRLFLPKYELEYISKKRWTGILTMQLMRLTPKSEIVQYNIDSLYPQYYSEVFPRNKYQSRDMRWTSNYLLISMGVGYNVINRSSLKVQFAASGVSGISLLEALKYSMKPYDSNEILERKIRFLPTPIIGASGRISMKVQGKYYGRNPNVRKRDGFGIDANVWTSPIYGVITDKSFYTNDKTRSSIHSMPIYGSVQVFAALTIEKTSYGSKQKKK